MRNISSIFILLSLVAISCNKNYELKVDTPDFDVAIDTERAYTAGDTVQFNFSGNADVITFNSGEKGTINLSFATQTRFGTQTNQLAIMASTNYTGEATEAAINAANWTNISSRYTFSSNTTLLSSGVKSVNDLVVEGSPLYIAFRYTGNADPARTQKNWWVNNLKIDNVLAGATSGLVTQATANWKFVNFAANGPGAGWNTVADGRILFDPAATVTASEGWAVARPIYPDSLVSAPAPIKAYIDNQLSSYSYVFKDPGTYKVVFKAANVTDYEQKAVQRELSVIILP